MYFMCCVTLFKFNSKRVKKILVTIFLTITILFNHAYAQGKFITHPLSFIENNGQIIDQFGKQRHDIQYKVGSNFMTIFVSRGQLHYQWRRKGNESKLSSKHFNGYIHNPDTCEVHYTLYRMDMELLGANPNAQVIPEHKQVYYEHYRTTVLHDINTTVNSYGKVTYKDIYPHIDWVLYIKDSKLEYDFVVNPGGDVNDIRMRYNGATDIVNSGMDIKIITPFGNVCEQQLYAYDLHTHEPVLAKYSWRENAIGFKLNFERYSTAYVIDPVVAWATYFGGNGEDGFFATATDVAGNIFVCGSTTSISNIATVGAYQSVYNGYYDAFIGKFNNGGNLLWASYLGGDQQDEGYAVCTDPVGNAYLTGWTRSTAGIATSGSHQTTYGGGYDAYLAKFSADGSLKWSTYFGGGSVDDGRGVVCDTLGNIYLTGYTGSKTNIATPGSYQDTIGWSSIDTSSDNAFIAKFNGNGSLLVATYFGGGGLGAAAVTCALDKSQNIYIGGGVFKNGIMATPGAYQDTSGGGWDGFIAKFDSSCVLKWSTYFGGDSGDGVESITVDNDFNLFVTGESFSHSRIATPGAHQTTYGGGLYDAFIAKFNDTGALQWATYYGGSGFEFGEGIACDNTGNAYITGYTTSRNNIATPGSMHDAYIGGAYDAFLSKFSSSGALLWGTFYGGILNDVAYGITCDKSGSIFIAGQTNSLDGISTSGSYQSLFADSSDAFLVKFDTAATSVTATPYSFNDVRLFPIPNNGNFTIYGEFSLLYNSVDIEIINMECKVVYAVRLPLDKGILNHKLKLSHLPPGAYLLKVGMPQQTKTIKFMIE